MTKFKLAKFKLVCTAAVIFSVLAELSVLASPAMARRATSSPVRQSVYCATREMGNPHSKYCDYLAWSEWRRWGSWDSRLDNACLANPAYIPGECGRDARGNVLFQPNVNVY
jgi:hypothetical protein